ncbi:MAG: tRNA (N(6)-L-threonylcarbamoyladenosine(37)-C(2))-methylthiotransferase MtaB [Bacteroidetes bacterium RIFCSPLOWO2_02_FULL_36_8]|nr:MAG: tRNA (N(6)-L-threonylcarbamoyladenosine(37)-C(2))-methylthiotransferase MtaB [Bacteroidetes bacterium RIFCSPLOWO2_02_FULL_36_8]OFY69659.1 MAG: tRNA (N(6)-L-threonylcarbamoyladenosine(37)-C(2))-methylthiotransferase MtaB [Bacteroidetes bacterium RIFCSPLOWO2_12_FULL_37_12]
MSVDIHSSKKVAFYTLGCKLNFSESSTLSREFSRYGYREVEFHDSPDIYVINSCSVTDNADKKCKKIIRKALSNSPNATIAVTGCFAQLNPETIAEIPGVDFVIGADQKSQLPELIKNIDRKSKQKVFHTKINNVEHFFPSYSFSEKVAYHHYDDITANDRTRSFLKIQDGCDYSCSFCTIPLARGKSRSGSIDEIKNQIIFLVSQGIKEIVLTGVNTGDFKTQDGKRFYDLLCEIENMKESFRLRISSIEPNLLEDDIIQLSAVSQKIMPHFHIPLQSGSDKILNRMRRRYLTGLYKERIEKIKSLIPHVCIGADVIVGFPGENENDFSMTCHFIKNLDISYLHVFTYSERPQTDAISLNDSVPQKIRSERSAILHELSFQKRMFFYNSFQGQNMEVLMEAENKNGFMYGFTKNYIRVRIPYDPLLVNELVWLILDKNNMGIKLKIENRK